MQLRCFMLHELLSLTRPLIILDLETTGVDTEKDRIVELAFQIYTDKGMVKEHACYVNPGIPIPAEATAVHGITDESVKDANMFAPLGSNIAPRFVNCDFGGKNVRFDLRMLESEMRRAMIRWDYADARILDAERFEQLAVPRSLSHLYAKYTGKTRARFYAIAKDGTREEITDLYWFEENGVHSFDNISTAGERIEIIIENVGQPHEGAHGALADVKASAAVLYHQLTVYPVLPRDLDKLHELQWPGRIDVEGKFIFKNGVATCTFGKYRGQSMRSISPDYWRFIIKNDFRAELKALAENALKGVYPEANYNGRL